MADRYAIVGQGWIADGTGTTDSTRRLVPGVNNINITGAGNLTVTMCSGTSASAASDVATVTDSPKACPQAAATVITVTGTGNIKITVTYDSTALWSSTYTWSATSGGISNGSVPTSADNVFFDTNSFTGAGQIVTVDVSASCLAMDWTGATNTPTLAHSADLTIRGSYVGIASMIHTGAVGRIVFYGANQTVNITWGTTISCLIQIGGSLSTNPGNWTFLDALNCGANDIQFRSGTLNTNGQTVTCATFYSSYTYIRVLSLGNSIINCTTWNCSTSTDLTITANTSTINCSGSFLGGGITTYNIVNLTGATSTISGSNTFAELGLTRAGIQTITFTDGTTQTVGTLKRNVGTQVKTLQGSAAAGWNITKSGGGYVFLDYLSISRSAALPLDTWYAGDNSIDGGNNTGWNFFTLQFYKDADTRFNLWAQDYTDIASRFRLSVRAYADILSRFKLIAQNYWDIATRFVLTVRAYRDIDTRFLLQVRNYKDIATRLYLWGRGYTDTDTRFLLQVRNYKDIATRLYLWGRGYTDTDTRFLFWGRGYTDTDTRFLLQVQNYRDIGTRFFLYQPTWKELQIQAEIAELRAAIRRASFKA